METQEPQKWTPEYWNQQSYMSWVGARMLAAKDGVSRIELRINEHHRGGAGTDAVNGAILAYLHDILEGAAVGSRVDEQQSIATLNLNISYMAFTQIGQILTGEGRVLRLQRAVAFAESDFWKDDGTLCCRASGTFRILRPRLATAPA